MDGDGGQIGESSLVVDLNEPVLVEQVLKGVLQHAGTEENQTKIMTDLIIPELLAKSFYREHLKFNYSEKIFFFEPINKYFDLPWLKKIVFDIVRCYEYLGMDWLNWAEVPEEGLEEASNRIEEGSREFENKVLKVVLFTATPQE